MCSSVMSLRAQVTFKTAGIYAASKAGVDMLVRYGAIEVSLGAGSPFGRSLQRARVAFELGGGRLCRRRPC